MNDETPDVQNQNLVDDQAVADMSSDMPTPQPSTTFMPQENQEEAPDPVVPTVEPTDNVPPPAVGADITQPQNPEEDPSLAQDIQSPPPVSPPDEEPEEESEPEEPETPEPAEEKEEEPEATPVVPAPPAVESEDENDDEDEEAESEEPADSDLESAKKEALSELSPLVDHLDIPDDEKFDTYMEILKASDDKAMVKPALEAAKSISDEDKKAQALLDIVKEIKSLE